MSIVVRRSSIPVSLTVLATVVGILIVVQLDAVAGLWSGYLVEVQAMQRDLHRQLAAAMRAVQVEGSAAAWALVVLSFLYGVFHAAGPGHGKVVISTYILTQESQLRRGLLLSLIASLCQGFTAVVAVSATVGLLGLSMRHAQGAATDLETLSYGLVALIGLTLVASRTRHLLSRRQHFSTPRDHNDAHSHASAHQHGHDSEVSKLWPCPRIFSTRLGRATFLAGARRDGCFDRCPPMQRRGSGPTCGLFTESPLGRRCCGARDVAGHCNHRFVACDPIGLCA